MSASWRQRSHQNVGFNEALFFIRVAHTLLKSQIADRKQQPKILHLPQIPSINPPLPCISVYLSPCRKKESGRAKNKTVAAKCSSNTSARTLLLHYFTRGVWEPCGISLYFLWTENERQRRHLTCIENDSSQPCGNDL